MSKKPKLSRLNKRLVAVGFDLDDESVVTLGSPSNVDHVEDAAAIALTFADRRTPFDRRLVYDYEKLCDVLAEEAMKLEKGLTEDEAMERARDHVSFNILGSLGHDKTLPLVSTRCDGAPDESLGAIISESPRLIVYDDPKKIKSKAKKPKVLLVVKLPEE